MIERKSLFTTSTFLLIRLQSLAKEVLTISLANALTAESKVLCDPYDFAGVYDALRNKYLKTLIFAICDKDSSTNMLESYSSKLLTFSTTSAHVPLRIFWQGPPSRF
jgi:hypothetical protein